MLVEAPVLDGNDAVLHCLGDLVRGHFSAVLVVHPGDCLAVPVGDPRAQWHRVVLGNVLHIGVHRVRAGVYHPAARARERQDGGGQQHATGQDGEEQFQKWLRCVHGYHHNPRPGQPFSLFALSF